MTKRRVIKQVVASVALVIMLWFMIWVVFDFKYIPMQARKLFFVITAVAVLVYNLACAWDDRL